MPWILGFVDAATASVHCHRFDNACRLRGDEYRMHCLEPAVRPARVQHLKAFWKLGDMMKE